MKLVCVFLICISCLLCAEQHITVMKQTIIVAEGALEHVGNLARKAEINAAFLDLQIAESQYAVLAGFNEALIQSRFGYLEEIHVFCCVDIPNPSLLLNKLGRALTPYPGIIFTPSSGYRTPVFKGDGTVWDYNDFALDHAQAYSDINAKYSELNFTSLAENQSSSSVPVTASKSGDSERGSGNHGSSEGDKDKDSGNPERNINSDGKRPEGDPGDPGGVGDGDSSTPDISFEVKTKLFKSTSSRSSSRPFQELQVNGTLAVQVSISQLYSCTLCENTIS